ncbi:hypothetical protein E8E11_001571 [Didymella keratinophila]|nr:hypothetical protein E8E11_001571 [Didymella keratinophila]
MTLPPETTTTQTHREEIENRDPFVTTPSRKMKTQTSAPATPKSKANTPLHKRFLNEVTMSPGIPSTPPRTPSRSPIRNKTASKQTLEVGQNGFYFSMEIPESKIVASRPASGATTPEVKTGRVTPSPQKKNSRLTPGRVTPGRLSPSPKKEFKSEVKGTPSGGGRVRDILRKNLFGTPTKKVTSSSWGDGDGIDEKKSPSKDGRYQLRPSDSSGSERRMEAAAPVTSTRSADAETLEPSVQCPVELLSTPTTSATSATAMSTGQSQTPATVPRTPLPAIAAGPPLALGNASAASTPSNIGHLMANHSNKSTKVQTLPASGGMESMPTPLRKMQERLGLNSPHVVRKMRSTGPNLSATPPKTGTGMSPISALILEDPAMKQGTVSTDEGTCDAAATIAREALQAESAKPQENRLTKLLPSPISISSPVSSLRPNTATTTSFPSPLTPSRPGLSSRSKSFGTPARLRSSMQEDMFKVQESLKRSLGQEAFEKAASRPTTPISPSLAASRPNTAAADRNTNNGKPAVQPVSVVGASKSHTTSAQAVPRKPLTTAARKPRPKSMIVGSAKVLETLASQIDSPRERAKLRSTGAAASAQQDKAAISRPSTAPWTSRGSTQTATTRKPVGTQPTARTAKSAAPGSINPPKRAVFPTHTAASGPPKQRVVSAEVIADRVAAWNKEGSRPPAPKPAPKLPVRSKSVKTLSNPTAKPALNPTSKPAARPALGRVRTPEPMDTNNDSGTAESFTPPGLPTQLPMSPSKKLLVAPTTPVPTSKDARKQKLQNAHRRPQPPSAAAQLRTPHPVVTPAKTPVNKRHTWVDGINEEDPNRYRTPSKEVQSRLDEAIDRKIQEDRMRAGWI